MDRQNKTRCLPEKGSNKVYNACKECKNAIHIVLPIFAANFAFFDDI